MTIALSLKETGEIYLLTYVSCRENIVLKI